MTGAARAGAAGGRSPVAGTNRDRLVATVVVGRIAPVRLLGDPYVVTADGTPMVAVGAGGITPTVRVGMPAGGWAAEQVEPAVSLAHQDPDANRALCLYACVGNRVEVQDGDVDGAIGVVTGKHEQFQAFSHVLVDFPAAVLEGMGPGARFVVRAIGCGLAAAGAPSVVCHSLAPDLWEAWAPTVDDHRLLVRVAATCPPELVGMGAGRLGATTSLAIQTADRAALDAHQLTRVRLGDLVAIRDWDARFAMGHRPGALTVGVVATGTSRVLGQGMAVTVLLSCADGHLRTTKDRGANIAELLGIGVDAP
ncbi:MAG TPA: DUF4438 domain-containing protein [Candidatus Micrarchaeia archaeon]|nr:DUF4438 domain-containing protein [Candidatus Micrarchaeia archaeon]